MTAIAETLTAEQAESLEAAFLGGLEEAQFAYERIVESEAWTLLGFDRFTDWWDARVTPTMRALSMRPTREIAAAVVERVREEEAELPPAQRRTQRELADMVGVSQGSPVIRPRSTPERNLSREDLEVPALVDMPAGQEVADAIVAGIERNLNGHNGTERPKPPAWDPEERRQHEAEVARLRDIEAARRTAKTFVTTIQAEILTIVGGYRLGERGLVTREQITQIRKVVDLLETEINDEE